MVDMREQRASRAALRGPEGRSRKRTPGQFKEYYEDMGVSSTVAGHKAYTEAEEKYKTEVSKRRGLISQAESEYAKAQKQLSSVDIPGASEAVSKGWAAYQKSNLMPVRVVDKSGKNIEATYLLPRSVAEKIASEKGLFSSFVDDDKAFNVSVKTREGGRTIGQELHEALGGAAQDVKLGYYKQAGPQAVSEIEKAKGVLAGHSTKLSEYGGTISSAKAQLAGQVAKHDESIAQMKQNYQDRLKTIKEVWGGLNIA